MAFESLLESAHNL